MSSDVETAAGDPADARLSLDYAAKFRLLRLRLLMAVTGIVLPILALTLGARDGSWRLILDRFGGGLSVSIDLLVQWRAAAPFYPLMALSVAALGCLLADAPRFGRKLWVQFGIQSGVVLAIHYLALAFWPFNQSVFSSGLRSNPSVLEQIVVVGLAAVLVSVVSLVVLLLTWWTTKVLAESVETNGANGVRTMGIVTAGAMVLAWFTVAPLSGDGKADLEFVFVPLMLVATPLNLLTFAIGMWLLPRRQGPWRFSLLAMLAWTSWFAWYIVAWQFALRALPQLLPNVAKIPTSF